YSVIAAACLARQLSHTLRWIKIATELHKLLSGVGLRHREPQRISDDYLLAWLDICRTRPDTNFYAYTKEVSRFRSLVEPDPPPNFLWVYSYGGKQDAALNPAVDRVADVFPDEAAIVEAGWASQEASDLLAVLGPQLVGVPANRIPSYLKRLAGRRFSEWQAEVDAARSARRTRLRLVVDNTRSGALQTRVTEARPEQGGEPRAA
uniref:GP88 family protein n=1 Tax=Amycolatopsis sp. cmx-4-61 TaxID=2790937 RepID=UPI00397A4555